MKLKQKLCSRKLWACAAGIIAGLAMVFGLDQDVIANVSGAVVSLASIVTYILAESGIDQAALKQGADQQQEKGAE